MSTKLCIHDRAICYDCAQVSDSAKRFYDIVQSYVAFVPYDERINSWVAIRLSDGGSDGNLYTSKDDAIRHQRYGQKCFYFWYRHSPNGMGSPKEAQVILDTYRAAEAAGRLPEPESGLEMIIPMSDEHRYQQMYDMGVRGRSNYLDFLAGK